MASKLTGKARSDALGSLKKWKEVPGRDAIQRSATIRAETSWSSRAATPSSAA